MSEVVYAPRIEIRRERGALRFADMPAEDEPVAFGVHGAVAEHYGMGPDVPDPHATTIDYVVAAAGG